MRSVLDEAETWDLESVQFNGTLTVTLVELRRGASTSLTVDGARVSVAEAGRRAVVTFRSVAAYQVVDEPHARTDEPRLAGDEGVLAVLGTSRFLDSLGHSALGAAVVRGELRHYRLCTPDFVLDAASSRAPEIEQVREGGSCAPSR